MSGTINNTTFGREHIYTLAESGTQKFNQTPSIIQIIGNGTDIINNKSLQNRARRKVITRNMILSLIDVVKEKGEPERAKAYWNAYHCLNRVIISENKMYGRYCKNRFCTTCTAIRKADILNRYYPVISQWQDVYFVTLTIKACKAEKLEYWINKMLRAFDLILNRCKKRHQRGTIKKLIGVRSLECNFNPTKKTYNPHFHIIVASKEMAILLKREWLKQWKPDGESAYIYKYANPKGQYLEPVKNLEKALIEIIKYGSKIFTDSDLKQKCKLPVPPKIYARALDNILVAMKGHRIFDRFGFNLPIQQKPENTKKIVSNFEGWLFPKNGSDWVNPNTGELLTKYLMPAQLTYILSTCIDIKTY